ncbi:hypothetical protein ACTMU2_30435 [Cupriavidus basilensis]
MCVLGLAPCPPAETCRYDPDCPECRCACHHGAQRREIPDGALVADGPAVQWVGATADLPPRYRSMIDAGTAQVIDMHGRVVIPGLVNTHHHMYQSLDARGAGRAGR